MNFQGLYSVLLWVEFSAAFAVFIILFFISAPYGRFARAGWGPAVRARTAWLVMELPAVLVIAVLFAANIALLSAVSVVFIILWQIHYLYRTFVYPVRMRGAEKPFPVVLVGLAFLFNIINGFVNGYFLFAVNTHVSLSWFYDPRFIIGAVLFVFGLAVNIRSDALLRELRQPDNGAYRVPYGGFFKYVSCPNYLGEICEWFGWAVLTWSLPGLAFALFTLANLAPRAYTNHRWYMRQFPDYPRERKALVPFIC